MRGWMDHVHGTLFARDANQTSFGHSQCGHCRRILHPKRETISHRAKDSSDGCRCSTFAHACTSISTPIWSIDALPLHGDTNDPPRPRNAVAHSFISTICIKSVRCGVVRSVAISNDRGSQYINASKYAPPCKTYDGGAGKGSVNASRTMCTCKDHDHGAHTFYINVAQHPCRIIHRYDHARSILLRVQTCSRVVVKISHHA